MIELVWVTSRSRVPVDGAAIASDVRESSGREQSGRRRGGMNELNEGPRNSNTGSESGVLITIAGHNPPSPAGGTFRHRSGGNSTPYRYYTLKGSKKPAYLSSGCSSTYSWCRPSAGVNL
ncbi:hypothetical protein AVEN_190557-2 [Araneus ventricosus]|uniref:Uncharacterized protein n=1 Tax=Araneus ventricosus TaxID=182803 RepID=A0A4Y2CD05_ARAVE|nr:hypothetical protein AVEN_190557-2 [Araneus ventricosus]